MLWANIGGSAWKEPYGVGHGPLCDASARKPRIDRWPSTNTLASNLSQAGKGRGGMDGMGHSKYVAAVVVNGSLPNSRRNSIAFSIFCSLPRFARCHDR